MLEQLTQEQLLEWGEFLTIEPLGGDVDDARHAMLLTVIARVAGSKTAKWEDFSMVPRPPKPDPTDGRAMVEQAKRAFALAGKPPPLLLPAKSDAVHAPSES